jgi:hypothetical protein
MTFAYLLFRQPDFNQDFQCRLCTHVKLEHILSCFLYTKPIIAFTFLLFFIPLLVCSQNASKGLKYLSQNKPEAARGIFLSIYSENPESIIANYGLASVYSTELFPAKNYLHAFAFIAAASDYLKKASPSELQELNNLVPSYNEAFDKLYKLIDEKLFVEIKVNNNLDFLRNNLYRLEKSKHFTEITDILTKLEFEKAKAAYSGEAISLFITRFPLAKEMKDAIAIRNRYDFDEVKKTDLIQVYNTFIETHPSAEQLNEAIVLRDAKAYQLAFSSNTLDDYDFFMRNYPAALQNDQVISLRVQKAYEAVSDTNTLESLQRFIYMNPNTRQTEMAVIKRDLLVFQQMQKLATQDAFNQFMNNYPFAFQVFKEFISNYPAKVF